MYAYLNRLLGIALLGSIASPAWPQSPSMDSLGILPPAPTAMVDVMVQVGGTHNTSGLPNIRTELRRIDSDIRLDVLIDEFFVGAPPMIEPWSRTVSLGVLPNGTYNLNARLFWTERGIGPSFPDPWPFPDSFGLPLSPGANGILTATFNVIPEPSPMLLLLGAAIGVAAVRTGGPRRPLTFWHAGEIQIVKERNGDIALPNSPSFTLPAPVRLAQAD